jgi:hypothetical protein
MYSSLYKNQKEVTTKEVAEHLFDFAEKVYKKSNANVLDIPALKSEPKNKQAKISFEYYCMLHSMITLIAWNSLDATKVQRNKIVRSYFEVCRDSLMKKAKNEKMGKLRFYTIKLRRNSYGKAYNTKTDDPFFNCGQLFRKIYDLIQYYSDPEVDKSGLSDKDLATMPNCILEKYVAKDNKKAPKNFLKVKENIRLPLQKITVNICNELKRLIEDGHKGVTIVD